MSQRCKATKIYESGFNFQTHTHKKFVTFSRRTNRRYRRRRRCRRRQQCTSSNVIDDAARIRAAQRVLRAKTKTKYEGRNFFLQKKLRVKKISRTWIDIVTRAQLTAHAVNGRIVQRNKGRERRRTHHALSSTSLAASQRPRRHRRCRRCRH